MVIDAHQSPTSSFNDETLQIVPVVRARIDRNNFGRTLSTFISLMTLLTTSAVRRSICGLRPAFGIRTLLLGNNLLPD